MDAGQATTHADPMVPEGIMRFYLSDLTESEWLDLRKPDVTASIVAALFDLHPYETLSGLYWAKRGVIVPDSETSVMQLGKLLEPAVGPAVQRMRPDWTITKAHHYWRDPILRLGATPDFYVTRFDNGPGMRYGVLQAKSTHPSTFARHWTESTAPTWIVLQVLTEMMLTNADFGAIAVLVNDGRAGDVHIYDVPRHIAAESRIRQAVAAFWLDLQNGVEPKFNYTRDHDLLGAIYPREIPGKVIDLREDNRIIPLLEKRAQLDAAINEAERAKEALDVELREKMGDAESALISGWRVSLKQQTRKNYKPIKGIISQALLDALEVIRRFAGENTVACHLKETSFRALRVHREQEF
jgi:predicted phage-related endonuclease